MHGFFHSFLGSSIIAVIISLIMAIPDRRIERLMSFLKLEQKHSWRSILLAAFLGTYLHVLLDSSLGYADIKPLFPLAANPFYTPLLAGLTVYFFCIISFLLGIALYFHKIMKAPRPPS
jgi:membrane-bound metal-dependent hydrolase YbcI (DUF457 family)